MVGATDKFCARRSVSDIYIQTYVKMYLHRYTYICA